MGAGRVSITDGVVAVGVTAALLGTALSGSEPVRSFAPLGYALLIIGGLALLGRRRAPVAVLVATGLCALGYMAVGFDAPAVACLFAVYATVRAGHRVIAAVGSVIMLVAVPLVLMVSAPDVDLTEAFARSRDVLPLAWLITAGAAGEALRQADRRASEAERTREEAASRRADEERLHIARELHDSLTHQISVIKLQAEVAVHLATKRGEPVPEALLTIRGAAREATRELRATLEALRDHDTEPPLGLADVPELVDRARLTGLDVALTIEGDRPHLPTAVDRTAYRIIQESLTNIARHTTAVTASVRVDQRPDVVIIHVENDGHPPPSDEASTTTPRPGVGLLGMRERVSALGGHVRAAPRDGGGFVVHAELPVDHAA